MRSAVPVTVAAARTENVPVELHAIGTVKAFSTVAMKSRVAGQLVRAAFTEGDHIKSGQLIFTIDPRPFRAALEQAQLAVADNDVAWHVWGYNYSSVGIENAGYAYADYWTLAQYRSAARLTASTERARSAVSERISRTKA